MARFLSRTMEWRRLRTLLDANADWTDVELRPLTEYRRCTMRRLLRPVPPVFPYRISESAKLWAVIRFLNYALKAFALR